jgi:DNA topoisomerase-1
VVSSAKLGTVKKIEKNLASIPPRYPFDLGELQKESFRLFELSPKLTLSIAQKLYQAGLISYPRTDSQKLPEKIGFSNIFQKLSLMKNYAQLVSKLQSDHKKRVTPWEGPNDDLAHPAIFPTGESPEQVLTVTESKVFDLIIKRFCNAFSANAIQEKLRLIFDISSFDFETVGTRLVEEGWTEYYPFGLNLTSNLDRSLSEGEKVNVISVSLNELHDQKPERFTEGSLLSKMESQQIGTKATRAETISNLIIRKYLTRSKRELVPTKTAFNLIDILTEKSPEIISVRMTRDLEKKLDLIRDSKGDELSFVEDLLVSLRRALGSFQKAEIRFKNLESDDKPLNVERILLSACPVCKSGSLLLNTSSKSGKRFISCTNFESGCKTSSPAFPRGKITPSGNGCPSCSWPMISVSQNNSGEIILCSNYFCQSRSR